MKTKLFLLIALFVLSVTVNAQTKAAAKDSKGFTIGAGAMVGLPMGDYSSVASLAYGVDLMGEIPMSSSLSLTVSAGYANFVGKSGIKFDSWIPVLGGVKIGLGEKLYGSAQAGMSFMKGGSAFTFAPGIGYKLGEKFDLLLKYQSASDNGASMSFLGLRAGLTF